MLNISQIVKKTEKMFDLFNQHFYNNELTRPAITVSPDGGRGAYGWCSIHEIWNADNELYREINLCAEYLDRPITEIAATLLHEMSHLYNLQHDIQDVSNNGYYHNMKFKATAEAHGLHIEKHPKYGWTVTTLAPEAEANQEASAMEISYNVIGSRRKELATAVGDFIGTAPVYQKAPTYAFAIGSYIIDRNGKLSGEKNEELTEALAAQGFTAA